MDRKDPAAGARERSLLSIGDALRESAPPPPSRLQQALQQARARGNAVSAPTRDVGGDRDPASRAPFSDEAGLARVEPLEPLDSAPPEMSLPAESAVPSPAKEPSAETTLARVAPSTDESPIPAPQSVPEPEPLPQPPLAATPAPAAAPAEIGFATASDDRWQPLIDPLAVVRGVWRSRRIIVACTVAGAVIGVIVALNTPRTYGAAAELLADPRDLNLVDRELTQPGISNEATLAIVDNQVRILTSGVVLAGVVERLNLAADPEFNGTAGGGGIGAWISDLRSLLSRGDGAADPARRQAIAVRNLAEALTVSRGGRTFVITIGATTLSPEKSALIANTTAEVFLQQYGRIQSETAGRAASELTGKLDELRAAVEAAERRVETFKAENDLIDAQGRLITDDEIVRLNEQLAVARARTLELNARAASARSIDTNDVLSGVLPEEIASITIQDLRSQYAATRGEIDRLSVRLGPRHPQLLALQAQLAGLREQIEAQIRRLVSSTQTDLRRAVQLEQELSARLAQLKVRQGDVSSELVTLRELERDASSQRAVYESYLLRSRQTGEQQGINSANISVITPATAPLESNSPSRAMTAIGGTVMGFLFGVMVGGLRGAWDGFRGNPHARIAGRSALPRRRRVTMFDRPAPAIVPLDAGDTEARDVAVAEEQALPAEAEPPAKPSTPSEPEGQVSAGRPHPPDMAEVPDNAAAPHPYGYRPAGGPAGQHPFAPPFQPAGQHPQAQPWPPHAAQGYAWGQGGPPHPAAYPPSGWGPAYRGQAAEPEPPAARTQAADHSSSSAIEEIRAGLRECREAIRELAEQRSRRRYF